MGLFGNKNNQSSGGTGGGSASTLNDLTDVDTVTKTPINGDFLSYNTTTHIWEPTSSGASLLGTWEYNGNTVIKPTSLDLTTDIFTATAHGLINGDQIFPMSDYPTTSGTAVASYPTGMNGQIYYVINATTDTFQISATSGGAAVDLTALNTFTSMHFEKPSIKTVTITGLGTLSKCRVRAMIRTSIDDKNYGVKIIPSTWTDVSDLAPNPVNASTFSFGKVGSKGTYNELTYDVIKIGSLYRKVARGTYATTYTDNTGATGAEGRLGQQMTNTLPTFTSIKIEFNTSTIYFANGTRVEVYAQ